MKNRILIVVATLLVGCSLPCLIGCADSPMRWAPTEAQKQAAALAVGDAQYLAGRMPDADAELARYELEQAAKTNQQHIGLPAELLTIAPVRMAQGYQPQPGELTTGAPIHGQPVQVPRPNLAVLETAQVDAARPQPTPTEIVTHVTEKGFSILQVILGAVGTVVVALGSAKGIAVVNGIRQGAAVARQAVNEIVAGIDALPAETKALVKAEQAKIQSDATAAVVAEAKAGIL